LIKKLEENEKQSNETPNLNGKSLKIIDGNTENNKDKNKNCCK